MRSYDPKDKYDVKTAAEVRAEPWMLKLLRMNPSYPHWGPHEDCMSGDDDGWCTRILVDTWAEYAIKELDDWNEVVHFYFQIGRDSKDCAACHHTGYSPAAYAISEGFYDFKGIYGGPWKDAITLDEVQALVKEHRLSHWNKDKKRWDPPPVVDQSLVDLINRVNGHRLLPTDDPAHGTIMGNYQHDAINRGILIKQRCKRLGYPLKCKLCKGDGYNYTADKAHVGLVLWVLHPRKGASRGVEVKRIERRELPEVFALLKTAADRNAERFARVVKAAGDKGWQDAPRD